MRRPAIYIAACTAAAGAAAVTMLALPAGAAPVTHHPSGRPAICHVLPHRVSDGTHSLRFYARQMHGSGAQVLWLSGYCSTLAELNGQPASVGRYHDFGRPFPAHIRLYGPLFG